MCATGRTAGLALCLRAACACAQRRRVRSGATDDGTQEPRVVHATATHSNVTLMAARSVGRGGRVAVERWMTGGADCELDAAHDAAQLATGMLL